MTKIWKIRVSAVKWRTPTYEWRTPLWKLNCFGIFEVGLVLQVLIKNKKKNYLLGLTHDVNHFNRDWVSSSLEPGIQVIGDKKCGVYKCEV